MIIKLIYNLTLIFLFIAVWGVVLHKNVNSNTAHLNYIKLCDGYLKCKKWMNRQFLWKQEPAVIGLFTQKEKLPSIPTAKLPLKPWALKTAREEVLQTSLLGLRQGEDMSGQLKPVQNKGVPCSK